MNEHTIPKFQAMNILDAIKNPPKALDYVLPGFLAGTIGAIVSPGGAGKSWLALQIAAQMACGCDTLGIMKNLTLGRVAIFAAEDPANILAHRLSALGAHLSLPDRLEIDANLSVFPLIGHSPDLHSDAWYVRLEKEAEGRRLIVLDTLRRFHKTEENDSGAMSELVGKMEAMASKTGCSILFLHHTAKGASISGNGNSQHASRGSSVLTDNIRWQANLATMGDSEASKYGVSADQRKKFVLFSVTKQNYGEPFPDTWLKRGIAGILQNTIVAPAKKTSKP